MTRVTKLQQLKYDMYQAYSDLDEVFAVLQLMESYLKNEESTKFNKWTFRKTIDGLKSLLINVQVNLESSIEEEEKKEEDDDGRC